MESLPLPALVAVFVAAAAVIVVAGTVLARSGDQIANRTGLGGLFVGSLLLAGATSLPELATDVTASLAGAPDIAVGDLFGSSMANMAILAGIDLIHRGRVWPSVSVGHARVATVAIGLTAVAVLGVISPPGLALGWVGIETVLIVVFYVAAAMWMRRSPTRPREGHAEIINPTGWGDGDEGARPLRVEVARFAIAAAVVLAAGPVLALSADALSVRTGIGATFVGTLFVAITTSLPEVVASFVAVRIGAYDLAVGNLFGSNAFNMTLLLAADVAYLPGPILAAVAPAQAVAGVGAIVVMAIALAAVVHGEETRASRLEPDALFLLITWIILLGAVYGATEVPAAPR